MPSATAIAVVGLELLYSINRIAPHCRHRRWIGSKSEGQFQTYADGHFLFVPRYGNLWSVERMQCEIQVREVLVWSYSTTPLLLRDAKYATILAKECHPTPPEGICWVPITT